MTPEENERPSFQARVDPWLLACFGEQIARDAAERNHRFLEEALALVQTCGCTRSEAHQLVDYVFDRAAGDGHQEAGGVMVTLAALCLAQGLDMHAAAETELAHVWTKVETIRAKQAAKPKHSPLPQAESTVETQRQALQAAESDKNWLRAQRDVAEAKLAEVTGNHMTTERSPALLEQDRISQQEYVFLMMRHRAEELEVARLRKALQAIADLNEQGRDDSGPDRFIAAVNIAREALQPGTRP